MLPRNSSVVETICPTRGETGSLFCYSFCSGENTCKFLETECKILTSSFQHSSLAETCEAINDNLLPSTLRTCGKKLVPSHESEALEGKQKLQMKTFSETCRVFSTDST